MAASARIVSIAEGITLRAKNVAGVWRAIAAEATIVDGETVEASSGRERYALDAYVLERRAAGVWTSALTVQLDLPSGHSHCRQDLYTIAGDETDSTVALALTVEKRQAVLASHHAAQVAMETQDGGEFTYRGTTYRAVFSPIVRETRLERGGFGQDYFARILSSRSQWEAAGVVPVGGQDVTWQGEVFRLVKVTRDETCYDLELETVNE